MEQQVSVSKTLREYKGNLSKVLSRTAEEQQNAAVRGKEFRASLVSPSLKPSKSISTAISNFRQRTK
jgi:hypothetical protein